MLWEEMTTPTNLPDDADGAGVSGKNDLKLDVHDIAVHGPGSTWDELAEEQREAWKTRLMEAGAWTQGMGESVFRGILFGQMREAVAHAVGG